MPITPLLRTAAAGLDVLLRERAHERPDALAFRYVADSRDPDGPGGTLAVTRAELDARAEAIAAALRTRVGPGDRVLLLHPHGPEYVAAFLGCLYAGVVAVPANPPATRAGAARVAALVRDAEPALFATTSEFATEYQAAVPRPDGRPVPGLATDLVRDDGTRLPAASGASDRIAFLQYTSGSTGDPRGVMVTHANLAANIAAMYERFALTPEDRLVSWLPPYHDMGLILGILLPLCTGLDTVLSSPFEFVVDPGTWVANLSRHRGTVSAAPNFAYDLCADKTSPDEAAALDLGAWRLAINGAEPVRRSTLTRFGEHFAAARFGTERIMPGYGLAEATLMVSGAGPATGHRVAPLPGRGDGPADDGLADHRPADGGAAGGPGGSRPRFRDVVGAGHAVADTEIRIVAPDTRTTRPDGVEGEVWVRAPGVASGYWRRPGTTAEVFAARTSDTPDDGPYLRTGDLGFLRDGELFVTGRIKDVLIVHGQNHYPQDLEEAAWSADERLRPGCAAAFDAARDFGADPEVVVAAEYDGPPEHHREAAAAAFRAVTRDCGLRPAEIVLVRRRTIPKTSAGKIRRRAAREAYLSGELDELARLGAADAFRVPGTGRP